LDGGQGEHRRSDAAMMDSATELMELTMIEDGQRAGVGRKGGGRRGCVGVGLWPQVLRSLCAAVQPANQRVGGFARCLFMGLAAGTRCDSRAASHGHCSSTPSTAAARADLLRGRRLPYGIVRRAWGAMPQRVIALATARPRGTATTPAPCSLAPAAACLRACAPACLHSLNRPISPYPVSATARASPRRSRRAFRGGCSLGAPPSKTR